MNGRVSYDGVFLNGNISLNRDMKLEEIEVSENGVYTPSVGYDGISKATVDVEANVESLTVNSNGTYTPPSGVDGFDSVVVNVPQNIPVLDTLNVNTNGTYTPPSGVDGYDNVVVNVPETPLSSLSVTTNGTYTAPSGTAYNEVNVDVPLPENAYLLEEYEDVPTNIASFEASDAPLKSLKVAIEPQQAGSGDPSPENVRPISGWTEEVIGVSGKNRIDLTYSESGGIDAQGEEAWGQNLWRTTTYIKVEPSTSYTYSTLGCIMRIYYYDANKNFIRREQGSSNTEFVFTTPSNCCYVKWTIFSGDTTTVYTLQMVEALHLQIEEGSTATTYEPYAGTTTAIPFVDGQGQSVTVYGGEIDVINGVVTPCPYYASYNGEQLTGEWISDRDVYSPNTTPTTGAQVVNIGATGTPLSVQPTSIKSLDGENNVFASTGDVEELKYFTKATS